MNVYTKIAFMGAVVKIHMKKMIFAIFQWKMDQKEDRGSPENGDMQVFSIRILFSTLVDASLKWAQNRTN